MAHCNLDISMKKWFGLQSVGRQAGFNGFTQKLHHWRVKPTFKFCTDCTISILFILKTLDILLVTLLSIFSYCFRLITPRIWFSLPQAFSVNTTRIIPNGTSLLSLIQTHSLAILVRASSRPLHSRHSLCMVKHLLPYMELTAWVRMQNSLSLIQPLCSFKYIYILKIFLKIYLSKRIW